MPTIEQELKAAVQMLGNIKREADAFNTGGVTSLHKAKTTIDAIKGHLNNTQGFSFANLAATPEGKAVLSAPSTPTRYGTALPALAVAGCPKCGNEKGNATSCPVCAPAAATPPLAKPAASNPPAKPLTGSGRAIAALQKQPVNQPQPSKPKQ